MDIAINEDEDFIFDNGDFKIDKDTRSQIMYDILGQSKNSYKEKPELCFNLKQLLHGNMKKDTIIKYIKINLQKDGFSNLEVNIDNIKDIKIYGDYDGLHN